VHPATLSGHSLAALQEGTAKLQTPDERPMRPPRAGFSWWEAWAQWRIWDFRKGLAVELQGFKN